MLSVHVEGHVTGAAAEAPNTVRLALTRAADSLPRALQSRAREQETWLLSARRAIRGFLALLLGVRLLSVFPYKKSQSFRFGSDLLRSLYTALSREASVRVWSQVQELEAWIVL